ncbi:MAG: MBL fold metallo-hydrolase [Desulfovibrionaceae bacterium]|nr:MBL fold metallo-hydrolase [Desulfovibrionaceae bacterium]
MLTLKVLPLGPLETNSHIIHNETHAIFVDVGGDPTPLLSYIERHSLTLEAVYMTHLHFDHIYGLSHVLRKHAVPAYVYEEDCYLLNHALLRPELYGLPPLTIDYTFTYIEPGQHTILGEPVEVSHTPGHTRGSLCYYFPQSKFVITGDVLFYQTIGRTDLPGGDYPTLATSIREKLFILPDETLVYPGHGRYTTIGHEKEYNPALEEF